MRTGQRRDLYQNTHPGGVERRCPEVVWAGRCCLHWRIDVMIDRWALSIIGRRREVALLPPLKLGHSGPPLLPPLPPEAGHAGPDWKQNPPVLPQRRPQKAKREAGPTGTCRRGLPAVATVTHGAFSCVVSVFPALPQPVPIRPFPIIHPRLASPNQRLCGPRSCVYGILRGACSTRSIPFSSF